MYISKITNDYAVLNLKQYKQTYFKIIYSRKENQGKIISIENKLYFQQD